MKETKELNLILEVENTTNELWGRMNYEDDLIVDFGSDAKDLLLKFDKTLSLKYKLKPDDYKINLFYDLTALFKEKTFLSQTAIAQRAGIGRSLIAQYASGIKHPSLERAVQIQDIIHGMGNELHAINLALKTEPVMTIEVEPTSVHGVFVGSVRSAKSGARGEVIVTGPMIVGAEAGEAVHQRSASKAQSMSARSGDLDF
jgi:hypothetical protein